MDYRMVDTPMEPLTPVGMFLIVGGAAAAGYAMTSRAAIPGIFHLHPETWAARQESGAAYRSCVPLRSAVAAAEPGGWGKGHQKSAKKRGF